MIRVLEVFGEPIVNGGQESFVMSVITHMDLSDMHVDLLTPYYCKNDYYRKKVEELGGNVYELGKEIEQNRLNIKVPILDFLKRHEYDVVHIHSGSITALSIIAQSAKKSGVKKVIVHSHSGMAEENIKKKIIRLIGGLNMLRSVDVYCACSLEAAKAKYLKGIINRTYMVKNGIDIERFKYNKEARSEIRNEYSIEDDDILIGHVGRFTYEKNHHFLINVFFNLLDNNTRYKLLLLGEGELHEEIVKEVKDKGISDKVIFVNSTNDVPKYMSAFDMFVLPSLYEGLPLVGVEAQASGLPVLVSDRVSKELAITDLVQYIECNNQEKWIKAIKDNEKKDRKSFAQDIRATGYDINETAKMLRSIYLTNK